MHIFLPQQEDQLKEEQLPRNHQVYTCLNTVRKKRRARLSIESHLILCDAIGFTVHENDGKGYLDLHL